MICGKHYLSFGVVFFLRAIARYPRRRSLSQAVQVRPPSLRSRPYFAHGWPFEQVGDLIAPTYLYYHIMWDVSTLLVPGVGAITPAVSLILRDCSGLFVRSLRFFALAQLLDSPLFV